MAPPLAVAADDERNAAPATVQRGERFGTGCLICRKEDHEDQILLCELCDGEYHTYCLQPALTVVPEENWYCANCVTDTDDGLERRVAALPPAISSRFGEVVFAQGGTGYGWWPALIFDPRLTVEPARSLARKHLGGRHLVYFFQCVESPFSVLPVKQIKPWIEGLTEDMHLGRAAKSHGKLRFKAFQEAMEVACLEMDKPAGERLDWEHSDPSQTQPQPMSPQRSSSSPAKRMVVARKTQPRRKRGGGGALESSARVRQTGSAFREATASSGASASGVAADTGWTIRRSTR